MFSTKVAKQKNITNRYILPYKIEEEDDFYKVNMFFKADIPIFLHPVIGTFLTSMCDGTPVIVRNTDLLTLGDDVSRSIDVLFDKDSINKFDINSHIKELFYNIGEIFVTALVSNLRTLSIEVVDVCEMLNAMMIKTRNIIFKGDFQKTVYAMLGKVDKDEFGRYILESEYFGVETKITLTKDDIILELPCNASHIVVVGDITLFCVNEIIDDILGNHKIVDAYVNKLLSTFEE